jgi:NAD(P)-dependent dehydrogenase (short-subunit alcohol dehydrogenase family)
MSVTLADRVVLVTGAEGGLGRSIAVECARAGARVCVSGIDDAGLWETVAQVDALGMEPALGVRADVRVPDDMAAAIDSVVDAWGRMDAVVANAGVLRPQTAFTDTSDADWAATLDVNLTGVFVTCRAAAQHLVEQGRGGAILAVGSSMAIKPVPRAAAYVASKAGVHALMSALALELADHRIRVNTIVPGSTGTDRLRAIPGWAERAAAGAPLGELVEPEEIGRLAAFVLSDAVPHMTGSVLAVDSGRTSG